MLSRGSLSFCVASAAALVVRYSRARSVRALSSALQISSTIRLNTGEQMPNFGLGTWLSRDSGCASAVNRALELGYRAVDTATMYENEAEIGEALEAYRNNSANANKVFLTTKLASGGHGDYDHVAESLRISLNNLRVKELDLWLMHSPRGGRVVETYSAMCRLSTEGAGVKSIGVSNFGVGQLEGLRKAGLPTPAVR